jgi:hypothetical protein
VLGDHSLPRGMEGELIHGGDVLEAAPYLRQAYAFATRAQDDRLIAEAASAIAALSAVSDSLVDAATATRLTDESLAASLRHGDLVRYYELADKAVGIANNRRDSVRAGRIADDFLSAARADADPNLIVRALRIRATVAQEQQDFPRAETLLREADGYAALLSGTDRAALDYTRAVHVRRTRNSDEACTRMHRALEGYTRASFGEGASAAQDRLRAWGCPAT